MRVAVCLSGQPRFFKKTAAYLFENLIDHELNDEHTFDVFCHTRFSRENIGLHYHGTYKNNDIVDSETLNHMLMWYKPQAMTVLPDVETWPGVLDHIVKGEGEPWVQYKMIYDWCDAMKMIQYHGGFPIYDAMIKTRYDFRLDQPLRIDPCIGSTASNETTTLYNIHNIGNDSVPSDWFVWGSGYVMRHYLRLYSTMNSYLRSGVLCCGEELLKIHCEASRIRYKNIKDDTSHLVRS